MRYQCRFLRVWSLVLLLAVTADPVRAEVRSAWKKSLLDDATLNDVTFVGQTGWAVGEQGVIRRTTDGGRTWTLEQAPREASLQSVCFLTNRIGWIAGGYIEPYTQAERGVLFLTNNGGETWQDLTTPDLPYLHKVKFFSLEEGVAIGSKMGPYGSGVLTTEDGGLTWRDTSSEAEITSAWRTGDFLSPVRGVIAGRRGALSSWGGNQLTPTQQLSLGRGNLRDVHLDPQGTGWIVGDQALLMRSPNAGVNWESPAGRLPPELRDVVDFLAVEQRGDRVWVAGKPGTVIWHSPDDGQTWQAQPTHNPTPLRAIHFRDGQEGIALGDFGAILWTSNGGKSWQPCENNSRRAGMLVITASPDALPFPLLSWYAGENGYRTVASIPVERETENDILQTDLRLSSALTSIGGNAAYAGHRLPVGLPDLDVHRADLIREWNTRTDGRLNEVLLGGLVAEIRQWRPEVIVLTHTSENDQVTQLLNFAVEQAAKAAADGTRHVDLIQNLGLLPWKVSRVVTLQPHSGPTRSYLSPTRPLVRMGLSLAEATELSRTKVSGLEGGSFSGVLRVNETAETLQVAELFRDLDVSAGGDARRKLIPLTQEMVEGEDPNPHHARQVQNMAMKARQQFGSAESVIGLLPRQLEGMNPEDAARMLLEMGNDALAAGDLTSAEGIWIQLVNDYEETLTGQLGMQKLIQFWSSEELAWHRSKQIGSHRLNVSTNEESVLKMLENPIIRRFSSKIYEQDQSQNLQNSRKSPIVQASAVERQPQDWHTGVREQWLRQAGFLGVVLSQRNPALLRDETTQRSLSVVNRHPVIAGELDTLFQQVHHLPKGVPTNWYIPPREPTLKNALSATQTASRPELDGLLNDDCWQAVKPEVLKNGSGRVYNEGSSFVKVTYDAEYLYIAASLLALPDVPLEGPQPAGRHYDGDLTGHDRLTFAIDVDGDHEFFYELTIDERGWTSETVGGLPVWNPKMFIATHQERGYWRIEAAVPLIEFAPPASVPGNSWGLAVRRTIPNLGWESWQSKVETVKPTVAEFGRLQFK
ncbi:MAG: hypothetical protein HUJ26_08435 [Planctomycetaceae bacterium]|nr:hypothetical protein [Planctomycetaceae bacterium]